MREDEHKEFTELRREKGITAIEILRLGMKSAKEKLNVENIPSV
jgi:hypothetical protein